MNFFLNFQIKEFNIWLRLLSISVKNGKAENAVLKLKKYTKPLSVSILSIVQMHSYR